jgi:uroporphyrinogen decarboxylase
MKTQMTSRERVWQAIHFNEPDRVPIDIGANFATGIHVDAYIALCKYLGYDLEPPKVYEMLLTLARMDDRIRRRLHCDVIELENPTMRWFENKDWKPWVNQQGNTVLVPGGFNPVVDGNGYIWIKDGGGKPLACMSKGGYYFDFADSVSLTNGETVKMDPDIWKNSLPLYTDQELRQIEANARDMFDNTEFSICGGFYRGSMTMVPTIAGQSFSDWMCTLVTEPDYAESIIHIMADRAIENAGLYLQAVGKYIDTIVVSASDFGTQKREMFHPDIWRDIYMPNYRRINDFIHQNSHASTFFHCCGSIANILEYFIKAGVDIVNPVQTSASGMDPIELKKKYGGRIVFWGGGADTQSVLPYGTIEEVRQQVKERIQIFAPGGGYVFNQIHDIQFKVPPENIVAMVDAAKEFGRYPIIGG